MGEVVLGVYKQKECLLLPRGNGLAGLHWVALSLPLPVAFVPSTDISSGIFRHSTGDEGQKERKGLGTPRGGRRQEAGDYKPDGGREVMENFLEIWTPKLRLKG